MCDGPLVTLPRRAHPEVDRRRFLGLVGATVAVGIGRAGAAGAAPGRGTSVAVPSRAAHIGQEPDAVAVGYGLEIRPRAAWGTFLPPVGPMEEEAPGDVRFLLVHHTASANDYEPDDVVGTIAAIRQLHVVDKGWPDVAYNFFVDRFGGVWEGREGSLSGPVKSDATGGSQGFTQLCCLIGEFTLEPPTPEALASLTALLAWLADSYGIDTAPGATATFTSRGSNRWPAGTVVTTATIAGHRDMSATACPGDACYPIVRDDLPRAVTALRSPATTTTAPAPTTTAAPTTSTAAGSDEVASPPPGGGDDGGSGATLALAGGAAGVAVALGAAAVVRRRRAALAHPGDPFGDGDHDDVDLG